MKHVLMIVIVFHLLISYRCTDCCDDFRPCTPVILGPKNLSTKLNIGQFDKGYNMMFKNAIDTSLNYSSDSASINYNKGNECDTTYLYERRNVVFKTNRISPKMEMNLVYATDSYTSQSEILSFNIGNSTFRLGNQKDSVVNLAWINNMEYYSTIDIFNTNLEKVYHLHFTKKKENEINGLYYSLEKGLMAFYIDNDNYWVRK
ncbi:MAG: hypothetical protein Q8K70_00640 [Bacteroidota bacterium]|nr:hypothetical protein [Bacteroidota bacterium]